jgi:hypothetical protein
MSSRKAQMFVVTAVFMASMIFVVQQALIAYSVLDMSAPFDSRESSMMRSVITSVNQTIRNAGSCPQFQKNLEELLPALRDDFSDEGYLMTSEFDIDCGYWGNSYPNPNAPLKLSLSFKGKFDSNGIIRFYHF